MWIKKLKKNLKIYILKRIYKNSNKSLIGRDEVGMGNSYTCLVLFNFFNEMMIKIIWINGTGLGQG